MFSVRFQTPSAGAEEIHPVRRSEKKTGEREVGSFRTLLQQLSKRCLQRRKRAKNPWGGLGRIDPPPTSMEITGEKRHNFSLEADIQTALTYWHYLRQNTSLALKQQGRGWKLRKAAQT